jgi:alkanesulfonate monooxygenase SsuD/methylene tetrahydromethanopterin reductase-like flavin-dependent oxidoreductase (luciferase family)
MEFGVFDHVDRNTSLSLADYYEARLQLVETYDRSGFYCYHVAENHATPLGMASSPSVYLAAVAQRSRQLRFGPLVYLLPFYHPLRLIEEICILDQTSRGRMQIGFGRGISPIETRYYGLDPDATRGRADEALEIILKGLTHKVLSHAGEAHRFVDVPMELGPFQKPHPPLWMGVGSAPSAANAARRGANIVSLIPPEAMQPVADAYYAACGGAGIGERKVGLSFFIVIDEQEDAARAAAARAYDAWYKSFNHLYRVHGRGPVLGERAATFAEVERAGQGVAGTPAKVAAFLREAVDISHVNYVLGQFAFGDLSPEAAQRSIALFASDVMPAVRAAASVRA